MSVPGPTYELRELKKVFADGTVAVDGISLTVGPGEQIAVIGPSGAGKTTLFRLLNLTLRPTSGSLGIAGLDMAGLSDQALRRQRQRIGTIYQQHNLVGRLRVVHNVLAGNLGRWSTARVLVQDPSIILADEPVSSVDPSLAMIIVTLLRDVAHESRKTLLMNLHSVDLALGYFLRIVGVRDGRIHFDLSRDQVTEELLRGLYAGHRDDALQLERPPDSLNPFGRACRPLPGLAE